MHRAGGGIVRAASVLASLAVLASAAPANAAPDATKVTNARSQPASPSTSTGASDGRGTPESGSFDAETSLEARLGTREGKKIWSIAAGLEVHSAFVQTEPDDARSRPDKLYNFFFVSPQIYVTPYDQLRADFGMYERFMADPGETGLRFADISATYTRYVPLFTGEGDRSPSAPPSKGVLLRIAASATAPTSYVSQLHGLITVPRLRVYLERALLDETLFLSANGFGEYYVERYRTAQGGGPNALSRYAVQVTADYFVPFHRQLSFGALIGSSWTYYYGVEGVTSTPYGTVGDPQFSTQPTQQIYNAELNTTYSLPTAKGFRTSAALTYAVGDNTVLHDGVQHIYYGFYRRSTELYATLTARY